MILSTRIANRTPGAEIDGELRLTGIRVPGCGLALRSSSGNQALGLDRTLRLMTLHVSATGWTGSLLLGESLHRGYPRSALRWQHASYERHQPHHAHSTGENCQVKRRHMEEHCLHGSARLPRSDQAQ